MVRLLIHSLFVAPFWAACPPTFDANNVHFTSRPEGKTHSGPNAAEEACNDLAKAAVDAVKSDPNQGMVNENEIKADCKAITNEMMQQGDSNGKYYDEVWNEADDCKKAVASFKNDGWLTCSGAATILDDVCFAKKGPTTTWTQTRFPLPDGGKDMCKKLAAVLAPTLASDSAMQPLASDLGYPASKVEEDCLATISQQMKKNTRACDTVGCGGHDHDVKTMDYCRIDTLDQQCATALLENDPVEQKLRDGCKCKVVDGKEAVCKKAKSQGQKLEACVQELLGKTSKDFWRIEVVAYDEIHQDHSVNKPVKNLDEAAKCLMCREKTCPQCSVQFSEQHKTLVNGCGSSNERCHSQSS